VRLATSSGDVAQCAHLAQPGGVPRFAVQDDIKSTNQPKTVKSILTKAGFKKNKQGYYA